MFYQMKALTIRILVPRAITMLDVSKARNLIKRERMYDFLQNGSNIIFVASLHIF